MSPYARFAAMVATSTVAMYLLMYLNVYSADHVFFSQTRMYMALIMGAGMAAIMLPFMRRMYPERRRNLAVYASAARSGR